MSDTMAAELPIVPDRAETVDAVDEAPSVWDTYSLVYALVLLFLVPAMASLRGLYWGDDRSGTYTFQYVSLVTVPFVLGVVASFLIDSREPLKRKMLRIAILTPLVVISGVTVMFTASLLMLPASKLLGIADQGLSSAFWVGLAAVAAPLVYSLYHRIRHPHGFAPILQWLAILAALISVVGLCVFSATQDGSLTEYVRKDIVVYLVGALTWYLPSFGISAGLWRSSGLV